MKKLVATLCLAFILVGTLTSCMGSSVKKFYKDFEYEEEKAVTKVTQLSAVDGYTLQRNSGNIFIFRDDVSKTMKFYNVKTDKVVLSLSTDDVADYTTFYVGEHVFAKVVVNDSDDNGNTRIYDSEGSLVCEKKGRDTSYYVDSSLDLFQFNGIIYRVDKNGKAKEVLNNPFFGSLPRFEMRTANYYYEKTTSNGINVYNYSLELVSHWEVPYSDVTEVVIHVINNDNILVQYLEILPEDAKKYDILYEGQKTKLTSLIVNAKSGNERKVNLDYVVSYVYYVRDEILNGDYFDFIPSGINTIAEVRMIENKRLTGDMGKKIVSLNNSGKIKEELFKEYGSFVESIAKNRFIATDRSDVTYLLDENGEKIGMFNAYANHNEQYVIANDRIYNYGMKQVYDFGVDGKSYVNMLTNSVLLKGKTDNYYLYTKSGETKSIGKDLKRYGDSFYITEEGSGSSRTCNVYGEDGNLIGSAINGSFREMYSCDDFYVISVYRDGKYYYYKVS